MGYVKIQATDMDRWRHFAFGVLGFAEGSGPESDALYLRMDERTARIIVVPGTVDRIVTVGWEVRDGAALARVKAALDAAGIPVKNCRWPRSMHAASRRSLRSTTRWAIPSRCSTARYSTTVRW